MKLYKKISLALVGLVFTITPIIVTQVNLNRDSIYYFDNINFSSKLALQTYINNKYGVYSNQMQSDNYYIENDGKKVYLGQSQVNQVVNDELNNVEEKYIYSTSADIQTNLINESIGELSPQWYFQSEVDKDQLIKIFRGNDDVTYLDCASALDTYINSGYEIYYFNDIYFRSKDELYSYLVNIYFEDVENSSTTSLRIKAPNGEFSNIINMNQKSDWQKTAASFIQDNATVVTRIKTKSGYKYVANNSENLDQIINFDDIPYIKINSNQGKQNYIIGLNQSDKYELNGSNYYQGYVDIDSGIKNATNWYRQTDGFVPDYQDSMLSKFNAGMVAFFNQFLSPGIMVSGTNDEVKYSSKYLFTEANRSLNTNFRTTGTYVNTTREISGDLIGSEYDTDLLSYGTFLVRDDLTATSLTNFSISFANLFETDYKEYKYIYDEILAISDNYASMKNYNPLMKIPLLFYSMMDRLISVGAPQSIVETTREYFRNVTLVYQNLIQQSLGNSALLPSTSFVAHGALNLVNIFGIDNEELEFDIQKYESYFCNVYPSFVTSAIAMITDVNANQNGLSLTNKTADYLANTTVQNFYELTMPANWSEIAQNVKNSIVFRSNNFRTLMSNDEIWNKASENWALFTALKLVCTVVFDTTQKEAVLDSLYSHIGELLNSPDSWEYVPNDNKFKKYAFFIYKTEGKILTPNNILMTINGLNTNSLFAWVRAIENVEDQLKEEKNYVVANELFDLSPEYFTDKTKDEFYQYNYQKAIEQNQNFYNYHFNVNSEKMINSDSLFSGVYMTFNQFVTITIMRMLGDLAERDTLFIKDNEKNLVVINPEYATKATEIVLNIKSNNTKMLIQLSHLFRGFQSIQQEIENIAGEYTYQSSTEWNLNIETIKEILRNIAQYSSIINQNLEYLQGELTKIGIPLKEGQIIAYSGTASDLYNTRNKVNDFDFYLQEEKTPFSSKKVLTDVVALIPKVDKTKSAYVIPDISISNNDINEISFCSSVYLIPTLLLENSFENFCSLEYEMRKFIDTNMLSDLGISIEPKNYIYLPGVKFDNFSRQDPLDDFVFVKKWGYNTYQDIGVKEEFAQFSKQEQNFDFTIDKIIEPEEPNLSQSIDDYGLITDNELKNFENNDSNSKLNAIYSVNTSSRTSGNDIFSDELIEQLKELEWEKTNYSSINVFYLNYDKYDEDEMQQGIFLFFDEDNKLINFYDSTYKTDKVTFFVGFGDGKSNIYLLIKDDESTNQIKITYRQVDSNKLAKEYFSNMIDFYLRDREGLDSQRIDDYLKSNNFIPIHEDDVYNIMKSKALVSPDKKSIHIDNFDPKNLSSLKDGIVSTLIGEIDDNKDPDKVKFVKDFKSELEDLAIKFEQEYNENNKQSQKKEYQVTSFGAKIDNDNASDSSSLTSMVEDASDADLDFDDDSYMIEGPSKIKKQAQELSNNIEVDIVNEKAPTKSILKDNLAKKSSDISSNNRGIRFQDQTLVREFAISDLASKNLINTVESINASFRNDLVEELDDFFVVKNGKSILFSSVRPQIKMYGNEFYDTFSMSIDLTIRKYFDKISNIYDYDERVKIWTDTYEEWLRDTDFDNDTLEYGRVSFSTCSDFAATMTSREDFKSLRQQILKRDLISIKSDEQIFAPLLAEELRRLNETEYYSEQTKDILKQLFNVEDFSNLKQSFELNDWVNNVTRFFYTSDNMEIDVLSNDFADWVYKSFYDRDGRLFEYDNLKQAANNFFVASNQQYRTRHTSFIREVARNNLYDNMLYSFGIFTDNFKHWDLVKNHFERNFNEWSNFMKEIERDTTLSNQHKMLLVEIATSELLFYKSGYDFINHGESKVLQIPEFNQNIIVGFATTGIQTSSPIDMKSLMKHTSDSITQTIKSDEKKMSDFSTMVDEKSRLLIATNQTSPLTFDVGAISSAIVNTKLNETKTSSPIDSEPNDESSRNKIASQEKSKTKLLFSKVQKAMNFIDIAGTVMGIVDMAMMIQKMVAGSQETPCVYTFKVDNYEWQWSGGTYKYSSGGLSRTITDVQTASAMKMNSAIQINHAYVRDAYYYNGKLYDDSLSGRQELLTDFIYEIKNETSMRSNSKNAILYSFENTIDDYIETNDIIDSDLGLYKSRTDLSNSIVNDIEVNKQESKFVSTSIKSFTDTYGGNWSSINGVAAIEAAANNIKNKIRPTIISMRPKLDVYGNLMSVRDFNLLPGKNYDAEKNKIITPENKLKIDPTFNDESWFIINDSANKLNDEGNFLQSSALRAIEKAKNELENTTKNIFKSSVASTSVYNTRSLPTSTNYSELEENVFNGSKLYKVLAYSNKNTTKYFVEDTKNKNNKTAYDNFVGWVKLKNGIKLEVEYSRVIDYYFYNGLYFDNMESLLYYYENK